MICCSAIFSAIVLIALVIAIVQSSRPKDAPASYDAI